MVSVGGVRSEKKYFKHIYRVFYMCGKLKITPGKNVEAFYNIWPALVYNLQLIILIILANTTHILKIRMLVQTFAAVGGWVHLLVR